MELEEVLHSKGLEQKHNVGQVGTLDLWHCGLQHLTPVGPLCVQTVTLPEGDKRNVNQEGEAHWVWTISDTQEKGSVVNNIVWHSLCTAGVQFVIGGLNVQQGALKISGGQLNSFVAVAAGFFFCLF